ncbi:MAG: hypothetical protein WD826_03340 [Actinomycetota bacterium]
MSDDGGRLDRLSAAVSRMRGGRRMDTDRMQLIAGATLAVLGLAAIIIGWYGAANTGFEFEQTPYLISGGLLGVALVFLGGFVYFAYWVTRLVRESRAQADRAAEILDQIAATLDGATIGNGSRSRATASRGPIAGGSGRGGVGGLPPRTAFVATRGGAFFHRKDCDVVAGRTNLRKVTPKTAGLDPCRICDPLS